MGPSTNSSNKIYLSVADGKFVQRVKPGTPAAIERVTKDNKTVHELRFGTFEGYLKNITVVEKEMNGAQLKQWLFDFDTLGQDYQIQIHYSSAYSAGLLKSLANPIIDFAEPITLNAWSKKVGDKTKNSIFVKQGANDIPWFFTKDNPNGLPELKKVMFKGKETWDDFDMLTFLEAFVKKNILPKLSKGTPVAASATAEEYGPDNAPEIDDLPF